MILEPVAQQRATEGDAVGIILIEEIIAVAAVAGDDEAQLAPGLVIGGGEADATFVKAGLEVEQILIDAIKEDQGLGCAHPIDDRIDA